MLNNTELDVTLKSSQDALPVPKLIVNSSKVTVASTNLNNNSQVPERKKTFFRNEDKYSRLEKYEEIDRQDPLNLPFVPPQGFKGPIVERKQTDRSWILLFIIIYVFYGVYSYFVMTSGNPERLAHGTDFRGEICGIGALKNKPFLYYAGPVTDINVTWCVRQCPPSTGRETCMYDTDHTTVTSFCYIQMQADEMGYYCVPKEPKSRELVFQNLGSFRNIMRRIASDNCFRLSIILSYLFTVLAKFEKIASGLILGDIILAQAGLILLAYLFYLESIRAYEFRCTKILPKPTISENTVAIPYYPNGHNLAIISYYCNHYGCAVGHIPEPTLDFFFTNLKIFLLNTHGILLKIRFIKNLLANNVIKIFEFILTQIIHMFGYEIDFLLLYLIQSIIKHSWWPIIFILLHFFCLVFEFVPFPLKSKVSIFKSHLLKLIQFTLQFINCTASKSSHPVHLKQINQYYSMLNNTELDVTLKSSQDALPVPKLIVNSSKVTVASTNLNNNSQVPERKKTFFRNEDKYSRLEKYEEIDRQDPLNLPFVPPQGFKGPIVERKQTDRSWILLFIIIYVFYGVYSYFVMTSGNPQRLAHGTDFRGEICGIGALKNKPFLYYAGPVTDINVTWCVRQCPPSTGRETCMYDTDHTTVTSFCYIQMQADEMGYYCVPKEPKSRELVFQNLGSFRNIMRRIASDLWQSWDITLIGFGLSIILSYLFTVLAKFEKIASGLIWGAIIFAQAGLILLAYLFYLESIRAYEFRCIDGMDPNTCGGLIVTVYYYLAFVFLGLAGVYLIVTMFLFRRIQRGIQLLKTAQHIVQVLGQIRSFPFIIAFAGLVICGLAFILVVFSMTVGTVDLTRAKNIDGHLLYVVNYSDTLQFGLIFVAFTVLFTLTLILTMNDMFTSYALSVWFFTKQKDTVRIPYCFSFKTLFKYHFGTCVFVAFNLMFLTIPQSFMDYSRSIMRCLPQTSSCVRYTQASCMACIHAFEVFLRYISKNSVVQVAIWSEPYYESAKKAYFLIFRNQNKIKDLDFLQTLIVFQIRLATAFMASIPVYMFINFAPQTFIGNDTNLIESPIVPTLYVLICGMFFSNVFQGSYDITCKTIIQLYCMDCEMFFGEQRFVEQFIREFMEFVGKIEDNEWKIGFTKQIKFDTEKFNKNLDRYNNSDGGSDSPKEFDENEQDDEERDQVDEDKYSDQYVDYDEKIDRGNAFIGLPTEFKPKFDNTKKPPEELGNASQSLIQQDQTMIQGDQTMALGSNKQLRLKTPILNTSQQSFQILLNSNANDKSQISQVSELDEKPKREKIIKKQRL